LDLYADADRRRLRLREYQAWSTEDYSHVPDIGVNKLRPRLDKTEQDFINRLTYSHQEKEKRIEKLRNQVAGDYDPATGNKLFQPQIGRGPIYERNTARLPIGEFLFASRHEFVDIRDRLAMDAQEKDEDARRKTRQLTRESQVMVDNLKKRAFVEIFETLVATVAFHKERVRRAGSGTTGAGEGAGAGLGVDEEDMYNAMPMFATSALSQDTKLDTHAADAGLLKPDIAEV
jgi:hypothetical protein